MLEVEIKAKIEDPEALRRALNAHSFCFSHALEEEDTYYDGVDRRFSSTDEALRVRMARDIQTGETSAFLTYKGPKLDAFSKMRVEHEVHVDDEATLHSILCALGHQPAAIVKKTRTHYTRGAITACLDFVEGLGSYLELETMMDSDAQNAAKMLIQLLLALGIPEEACTRKSYLELLDARLRSGY